MAEKKKKTASLGAREIIREQMQLTQTETDLKKMIESINDHINQLMVSICRLTIKHSIIRDGGVIFQVEELQLKSGLMSRNLSGPSGKLTPARNMIEDFDAVAIINEQQLNLRAVRPRDEEEYDDE